MGRVVSEASDTQALHRARLLLAAIVLAFCLLGTIYSVVVPLFEAPDEVWHFTFAGILADEHAIPVQSTQTKDVWLRESGQPPLYYMLAAPLIAAVDTSDFPGFVRFNSAHPAITPGLVSDVTNVFIHTPHESFPFSGAVLAIHAVRLLSVLLGAATVVGAYLIAREIVPGRPGLAVAAAAFTAFNPHFVFISSVVNNDVAAALMATLVLWLILRVRRDSQPVSRFTLALGAALGLAMLTKLSALALLPITALALALIWRRDRDLRALVVRGAVVFGIAMLAGAWWYVRNWVLYGDPLAWGVWTMDLPPSPIGTVELVRQFGHVATSYWSPYDNLLHPAVFLLLGVIGLLAVLGWIVRATSRDRRSGIDIEGIMLTGAWLALLTASLVKYMTTTPSNEGRLLFPGIGAIAVLVVLGLDALAPERWSERGLSLVSIGLLTLCVVVPFAAIGPRFAPPLLASEGEAAIDARFGNNNLGPVGLLGAQIEPLFAESGDSVDVTLYWEALAAPPDDLRAVVQLWTVGGRLLGQHDTSPAGAVYPPDLWRPGDVVRDTHHIAIGDGPAMALVTVVVMAGDQTIGRSSTPPSLRIDGPPIADDQIPNPTSITIGDEIQFWGYEVSGASAAPGDPLTVSIYWEALAEVPNDYVVFLHLLDPENDLLAQSDGPPFAGDLPTSFWPTGLILTDTYQVPWEGDLPEGATLLVGLYRLDDGVRVPAYGPTGLRLENDAIQLDLSPSEPSAK